MTSDQTGNVVAAAILNGSIYRTGNPKSTTGWQAGTLEGSSTALVRPWRALAASADAGVMVAASDNGEVYVSTTAGLTWALRNVIIGGRSVTSAWHSVAISDDGNTIAIAGRANSALYVSRDRSLTWVQTPAPIGDYTALAMSADGHQFVVAAGTPGSAAGQLYTSLGNRTSIGAAGSIGGGINDFVELEYLGNARFKVRSFDGGPFTIR